MEKYFIKGFLIGVPFLVLLYFLLQPGESDVFPPCPFHSATGLYCPGCGSQRALHNLLHLNLKEVAGTNFLFIPALLVIGYHYIHQSMNRVFKLNLPNIIYMKITPWIILVLVLLFLILRNLPFFPFTLLAPN